jgi:hypothetical protein
MLTQITQRFWQSPFAEIIAANRYVLLIMAAGMAIHLMPERWKMKYRKVFSESPLVVQFGTTLAAIGLAYLGMSSGLQTFIYFQF